MKSRKDILIVGQGIGGSLLGWQAQQNGLSFDIYDPGSSNCASAVSSGIINPITGPKYIKSWRIDEFYPCALEVYQNLEKSLNEHFVYPLPLWRHLPNIQKENIWNDRCSDPRYQSYVSNEDHSHIKFLFNDSPVFGRVHQAFRIDVGLLLESLRFKWRQTGHLFEHKVEMASIELHEGGYLYEGTIYESVILAKGHNEVQDKIFQNDAFRPVKGEVLLCRIKSLGLKDMIKKGKFIIPYGDDLYWIGSNYQYDYEDAEPDVTRIEDLVDFLENNLVVDYEVVEHLAGIRPATKYRRPLIGEHPTSPNLYLFNGLGTKGISMAPYFSHKLIFAIKNGEKFSTEAFDKTFGT